jgi:hypothetical protein
MASYLIASQARLEDRREFFFERRRLRSAPQRRAENHQPLLPAFFHSVGFCFLPLQSSQGGLSIGDGG